MTLPSQSDTEWYVVTLTPRQFRLSSDDWLVSVKCPNGEEIRDSAAWRWLARWKARWIVWEHRRGVYGDNRRPEEFRCP